MLSVIALRVVADPFKTVKKMIKDLIVRLMEEANWGSQRKRAALRSGIAIQIQINCELRLGFDTCARRACIANCALM